MQSNKISIVIPTFNEETAIPWVLEELVEFRLFAREQHRWNVEVIVVDDGSLDRSVELVKAFDFVRLIRHEKNLGYGAAIKTGVAAATSDFVAFMDMDATYHVKDLLDFHAVLVTQELEMVVGDRQLRRGAMPFSRRVGNFMFSSLVSQIYKRRIKDCCSGIRMIRRSTLVGLIHDLPNDLDFALALTLKMLKEKRPFSELPTKYKPRLGSSKLHHVEDGLRFLSCIVRNGLSRNKA